MLEWNKNEGKKMGKTILILFLGGAIVNFGNTIGGDIGNLVVIVGGVGACMAIYDVYKKKKVINSNIVPSQTNNTPIFDQTISADLKYCQYCGSQLKVDSKFCFNCGKKLT